MTDLAQVAGRAVAVPLAAIARWRRGKPMHPRGAVLHGVLERHGGPRPWGVPWLDATASDPVLVRLSRGAGLPALLPDALGIAVRLGAGSAQPVDLLLTSAGSGPLTRLVPLLRSDAAATYSSIMAYSTAAGPVRLAAFPDRPHLPSDPEPQAAVAREHPSFTLAAAHGLGPWHPFARLTLTAPVEELDPELRFDAVRHPPPGLVPDGPIARFRAPAYAAAQAVRSA
ncbi:phosphodiesterase [Blastococcus sp. TF02A-30]|uniref:phosphodiesterase n=1 Tax=Blastococcus sp. TF02A-30 TaxID=2250580 RepID=UPI000DE84539|nr:phosphodiesterase [Blastococcus sp. TF02A-30]RBY92940.1 phosphodiesterase [Blastococcus sp. TF02A-30]